MRFQKEHETKIKKQILKHVKLDVGMLADNSTKETDIDQREKEKERKFIQSTYFIQHYYFLKTLTILKYKLCVHLLYNNMTLGSRVKFQREMPSNI